MCADTSKASVGWSWRDCGRLCPPPTLLMGFRGSPVSVTPIPPPTIALYRTWRSGGTSFTRWGCSCRFLTRPPTRTPWWRPRSGRFGRMHRPWLATCRHPRSRCVHESRYHGGNGLSGAGVGQTLSHRPGSGGTLRGAFAGRSEARGLGGGVPSVSGPPLVSGRCTGRGATRPSILALRHRDPHGRLEADFFVLLCGRDPEDQHRGDRECDRGGGGSGGQTGAADFVG